MAEEKKRFIYSLVFPAFFLLLLWAIKFFEMTMDISLVEGGVYPRKLSGLKGILFSPLIHGDWKHLVDNSMPVLLLSLAIFYFYRDIAYKIWFLIYFIAGILLWGDRKRSLPHWSIWPYLWHGSISLSQWCYSQGEEPDGHLSAGGVLVWQPGLGPAAF